MVLAVFIFFIIIVVLTIDIRVSVKVNYDFDTNIGSMTFKMFGIKLYDIQFSLVGDYINFVQNNKKIVQIRLLDIDTKTIKLFEDISKSFVKRINPLYLGANIIVSSENAFVVSLAYGALQTFMGALSSMIIAQNEHVSLENKINMDYFTDSFVVCGKGVFLINLYDLMWSIVRSLYIRSFGLNGKKESSK